MIEPTVLVVIPVFNREKLIVDALASVAAQTRPPDALVVIDDGSTDGSAMAVELFFSQGRFACTTKLIRQENRGVGAARARAIEEAPNCNLLAMLDSDDLWPPDYLHRMAAAFTNDPGVVGASCDRCLVDMGNGKKETKRSSHLTGEATRAIFSHGTSPSSATVLRMEAFDKAGGYDRSLKYKDDADLYLRVSLLGRWAYVPELTVTLRRNTAAKFGGPQHLTRKSIPNRLEMAVMLERFIQEKGGRDAVPASVWRPQLARHWFRLGREFRSEGQRDKAAWCFRHATSLAPLHLRAWFARWATGGTPANPVPQ